MQRSTHSHDLAVPRPTRATRPSRPSRPARLSRHLAIGTLVASAIVVTPAAAADDPSVALSGPVLSSAIQPPLAPDPAATTVTESTAVTQSTAVTERAAVLAQPVTEAAVVSAPEAAPTLATRQASFLRFTTSSPQALDRRGVEPSLYRGRFFRASVEEIRRCIVRRESSGVYTVRGGGGDRYYGAYQMNDRLADGATWMMLPEAKRMLGEPAARALMARLRAKPVTTWSRYWQDAAFFTIYNWERTGSGRQHWAGGRWHC